MELNKTFCITDEPYGSFRQWKIINRASGEYVAVVPGLGAMLNQVALKKGNELIELLNGCENYEAFLREGLQKFKGSKLFPFPNRIADGRYTFQNSEYHFPVNFPDERNAIHGTVLKSDFKITGQEVTDDYALLSIQYETPGDEPGYPFSALITICYSLHVRDGFTCTTYIENKGNITMPVGDGWHPYFKTGSAIDACKLTLPVINYFEADARMIPTGRTVEEKIFVHPTMIGSKHFDTGYKLYSDGVEILSTVIEDPIKGISLIIWQEAGERKYDYVQIYTPPDRLSIAVEPMTCPANAFNNGKGLITLEPDQKVNFSFGLKLE